MVYNREHPYYSEEGGDPFEGESDFVLETIEDNPRLSSREIQNRYAKRYLQDTPVDQDFMKESLSYLEKTGLSLKKSGKYSITELGRAHLDRHGRVGGYGGSERLRKF